MSKILGISAFYHDSSACLLDDGQILTAVQEERFSRIKHDQSFPSQSIKFILEENNLSAVDIDYISFYEKPFLKFERLIETYIENAPRGFNSFRKAMPIWMKEKLYQKEFLFKSLQEISTSFSKKDILFSEHHLSHAASAFYPSPFDKALILTIDGVGEWATTSVALGEENKIDLIKEIHFPHSLGLLYSAFTYYLGFKVNGGEYKVMGLAPYGEPKYKNLILDNLLEIKKDGSFGLNQDFFNYSTGLTMVNEKFCKLFSKQVRNPESELLQFHMDIAASVQSVIEEALLKMVRVLSAEHNLENLCLAGGVALNCVANSKIQNSGLFKNVWVQPAAGDAGGSLGAALATWHMHLDKPKHKKGSDSMRGSYLGPSFSQSHIETFLNQRGINYNRYNEAEMIERTAILLSEGKAVGWFQGKMEYGPRALGSRSILADPRSNEMQENLNLKVKFRESFRPFAPSILEEDLSDWFETEVKSPYMLFVAQVKKDKLLKISVEDKKISGLDRLKIQRSKIPAVTHVDYSARIQTVNEKYNNKYYKLIKEFKKLTGCPILVNTSFNVRGEPIVCSPHDAYTCFKNTNLDYLVMENCIISK